MGNRIVEFAGERKKSHEQRKKMLSYIHGNFYIYSIRGLKLMDWKSLINFHNCIRFLMRRRTGRARVSKPNNWIKTQLRLVKENDTWKALLSLFSDVAFYFILTRIQIPAVRGNNIKFSIWLLMTIIKKKIFRMKMIIYKNEYFNL